MKIVILIHSSVIVGGNSFSEYRWACYHILRKPAIERRSDTRVNR